MEQKNVTSRGTEGRLPAMAPLANPYVPFQMESPPKYEARKGIIRGTLFPGLDLPFMGMVNKNELPITPKTELQVLAFAIHELALYLDTHRNDREALELYQAYQQMYHEGMKEYCITGADIAIFNWQNHNTAIRNPGVRCFTHHIGQDGDILMLRSSFVGVRNNNQRDINFLPCFDQKIIIPV